MEEIENIVASNLTFLRKNARLTQLEFGEKFNYSDKTVSKWEMGSVVPSVQTLKEIADFYGVTVDYLLNEHKSQKDFVAHANKKVNVREKGLLIALLVSIIWCIAATVYVAGYLQLKTTDGLINRYWTAFVWSVPISFMVISYYTHRFFKDWKWTIIHASLTVWTALVAAYVVFFYKENYWFLFVIGIPLQASLILFFNIKKSQK